MFVYVFTGIGNIDFRNYMYKNEIYIKSKVIEHKQT